MVLYRRGEKKIIEPENVDYSKKTTSLRCTYALPEAETTFTRPEIQNKPNSSTEKEVHTNYNP